MIDGDFFDTAGYYFDKLGFDEVGGFYDELTGLYNPSPEFEDQFYYEYDHKNVAELDGQNLYEYSDES